jgi:hypothetical protein
MTPSGGRGGASVKKILIGVIIVVVIGGVFALGKMSGNAHDAQETNDAITTTQNTKDAIPAEAKSFVAEYGERYDDTATAVSVFYAEKAYEQANGGKSLMISDDAIDNYQAPYEKGGMISETSQIAGFEKIKLPSSYVMNEDFTMNVFNEYTAKELSLFMNYYAKNPNAKDIIESEFQDYLSSTVGEFNIGRLKGRHMVEAYDMDTPQIKKLMKTAEDIVDKYGSNAMYSIAPATNDPTQKDNHTSFVDYDKTSVTSRYTYINQPVTEWSDAGVSMLVNIDQFDVKGSVKKLQKRVDGMQLTYIPSVDGSDLSIGQK